VGATEQARHVVRIATEEAAAMGHVSTGPEHLLLALLRDDEGPAVLALEEQGVHYSVARRSVRRLYGQPDAPDGPPLPGTRAPISNRAREALERAIREAIARGDALVGVEHVLTVLLRDTGGGAVRALEGLGIDPGAVASGLSARLAGGRGRL
jgi:ATP-dependent Clp protease ATP-binding subunit ClpC